VHLEQRGKCYPTVGMLAVCAVCWMEPKVFPCRRAKADQLDKADSSESGTSQMLRFCCRQGHPDLLEQE
jgi:hypothetical protein